MWKKSVFSSILILLLCIGMSFAATTGKISGRLVDAETGEPLVGANVVIEGTQMGAAADLEGYYFIINIRPGQYTLKASMMGYTPVTQTNVTVMVDRTTTIDFNLGTQTIEGEQVTIVATRPIVQLDVSSSQKVIAPQEIENTMYHNVANVMASQAGIEGFGANKARPRIRGSSMNEAQFVMDGMTLVDEVRNAPLMKVNLAAVQEIQVLTGGFNAEYGNFRSGLINVITKEGTKKYTGSVDFKYAPPHKKHFGPNMYGADSPLVKPYISEEYGAYTQGSYNDANFFPGWLAYAGVELVDPSGKVDDPNNWKLLDDPKYLQPGDPHYGNPNENLALWLWRHRSDDNLEMLKEMADKGLVDADMANVDMEEDDVFTYGDLPDFVGELTFGGPVPFTNDKVSFFLSHRQEQTAYARTFPTEIYEDRMTTLKLTARLTDNMKLTLNGNYLWQHGTNGGQGITGIGTTITNNPFTERSGGYESDVQQGMGSANKMWYPNCNVPAFRDHYTFGFQFSHQLTPKTFYEVTFSHLQTETDMDQNLRNTIAEQGKDYNHLKYGRLGTEDEIADKIADGAYDWDNWQDYAKIQVGDYWYDEAPWGWGPVNWRDVTGEYRMESCNLRVDKSVMHYYTLKSSVTSQFNRFNQLKAGFELKHKNLNGYYGALDPSVNGGSEQFIDAEPWQGALFVQDKLEFKGMIANIGLRWDWQARPEMVDQDGPNDDPVTGPYNPFLGQSARFNLDQLNWDTNFMSYLSPRIGISHPMSENSKIYFNYGHFVQWPSDYDLYYYRFELKDGNRMRYRGNPNLEPAKNISYEVGYAQNIADLVEVNVNAYYRDITDETFEARYYGLELKENRLRLNGQYKDVRGVEITANMRWTRFLSGYLSYNHMVSSRGQWGYDRFYEDETAEDRRVSSTATQPIARPVVKANIDFHTPTDFGPKTGNFYLFGDMSFNLLYTWRAGEVFTWNPDWEPYVENNIRWRPYQMTNFRFSKRLFRSKNIEPEIYIDVANLFNNKNMSTPRGYSYKTENYAKQLTGVSSTWAWDEHKWWKNEFLDYMNSLDIDGGDRPGDYDKDYIDMPSFTPWTFLEKREIFFGIRINFY